jgi:hypothetical protein
MKAARGGSPLGRAGGLQQDLPTPACTPAFPHIHAGHAYVLRVVLAWFQCIDLNMASWASLREGGQAYSQAAAKVPWDVGCYGGALNCMQGFDTAI